MQIFEDSYDAGSDFVIRTPLPVIHKALCYTQSKALFKFVNTWLRYRCLLLFFFLQVFGAVDSEI